MTRRGDGSVCKALALKAGGSEFKPRNPHKSPAQWLVGLGQWRQEDPGAHWPARLTKQAGEDL